MKIISLRKRIADMKVVNDVKCMPQIIMTCDQTIFMAQRYPLNNDKFHMIISSY